MEPGLRLLTQLVIEFTPVIVTLIQKRTEESLTTSNLQFPQVIQEFIQTVNLPRQRDGVITGFEQQKLLQQELAVYQRETQLQIATQARETSLKLPEVAQIFDNWPLRLYPSQILDSGINSQRPPLKIFLAPPQIKFDQFDQISQDNSAIELILAEGLREFLHKHYSLHSPIRPTELLAGAWDSKRFHSESSIKALFGMLKTEPILILESEHDGDYLNFRIAYWGLGQETYYYKTIFRLPYREILHESAKSRALEWRKIRNELLLMGEDIAEINHLGEDNVLNLEILEKSEKWQAQGIDISQLSLKYQVNHQDLAKLCQVLINCHCLVAAWVADAYHLVDADVPPLLPEVLPSLLQNSFNLQSVQELLRVYATGYQEVYQALEHERRYWVPELALQLAQSLSHLPDRSWAQSQVDYSINTWLELRQVSRQDLMNPFEAMQSALKVEDKEYLEKLKAYFIAVSDRQGISDVDRLLDAIAHMQHQITLASPAVSYTLKAHSGKVASVAISSDGGVLVSGCADKTINIWNLQTGKQIRTLTDHKGEVSSVAISPDSNFLAVGSCEHPRSNVRVWDLKTGKLLHTLLGHQKPVNVVAMSHDGQMLASGSNKIKIWNLHTGDRICTLWHTFAVHAIAISRDGKILVSGSADSKIRLWNPRTGDPLSTFIGHSGEVKSIAISPDGQLLFSGSADTTIKIWHLNSGKLLHTLSSHADAVQSLAISPDGKTLFSSSADKTIKIWQLSTGEVLQTLTGHSGSVNAISLSPDGKLLASGSADKTIKIWQI
ncbi:MULTISPECIES: WD40 repeat domain-containing protein [unclassified Nodularia (in: cyanobacteria)]|uniref:WD40 repeat domain-containing protein n=1 Tax=unclassified Nodularia (in: cyanobacteria) TaxID=2656917 RepID=UPI00187FD1EC|nr:MULTISPECIES: WD40 repeat domain-containing protein [unclassified Nodularia (in: cyanobacteria)]MBE9200019.1 WD40 repeat domain-containing protein [Nodularia sp. LEGE 06071]MCC2695981.1 WD40 repeat domain-containing protein [Nodularia sp. LEGE 04288]